MSIYERALRAQGFNKRADNPDLGNQFAGVQADGKPTTEEHRLTLADPNNSFADQLKAYMALVDRGENPAPSVQEMLGRGWDAIKRGASKDLSDLHRRYTVAKNDAKARYNKFKKDLPGMYGSAKKSILDFYRSNKPEVLAGATGAIGGGTLGAMLLPKHRILGAVGGSVAGTAASLGALRIARYLGYV